MRLAVGLKKDFLEIVFVWRNKSEQLVHPPGTQWLIRGDEEGLRSDVDYALKELGVEYIDIIVLCRISPSVPIEERLARTLVIDTMQLAWDRIFSSDTCSSHLMFVTQRASHGFACEGG